MSEVLEILLRARDLYAEHGVARTPHAVRSEHCLATAIRHASANCDASRTLETLAPYIASTYDTEWSAVVAYNDSHTKAENLAVLDRAIEAERARCAADRVAAQVTDIISAAQSASAECEPVV